MLTVTEAHAMLTVTDDRWCAAFIAVVRHRFDKCTSSVRLCRHFHENAQEVGSPFGTVEVQTNQMQSNDDGESGRSVLVLALIFILTIGLVSGLVLIAMSYRRRTPADDNQSNSMVHYISDEYSLDGSSRGSHQSIRNERYSARFHESDDKATLHYELHSQHQHYRQPLTMYPDQTS